MRRSGGARHGTLHLSSLVFGKKIFCECNICRDFTSGSRVVLRRLFLRLSARLYPSGFVRRTCSHAEPTAATRITRLIDHPRYYGMRFRFSLRLTRDIPYTHCRSTVPLYLSTLTGSKYCEPATTPSDR